MLVYARPAAWGDTYGLFGRRRRERRERSARKAGRRSAQAAARVRRVASREARRSRSVEAGELIITARPGAGVEPQVTDLGDGTYLVTAAPQTDVGAVGIGLLALPAVARLVRRFALRALEKAQGDPEEAMDRLIDMPDVVSGYGGCGCGGRCGGAR